MLEDGNHGNMNVRRQAPVQVRRLDGPPARRVARGRRPVGPLLRRPEAPSPPEPPGSPPEPPHGAAPAAIPACLGRLRGPARRGRRVVTLDTRAPSSESVRGERKRLSEPRSIRAGSADDRAQEDPVPKPHISYVPLEADGRAHAGGDAPLRPRGHAAAGELRGARARAERVLGLRRLVEGDLPQRRLRPHDQGPLPRLHLAHGEVRVLRQPALGARRSRPASRRCSTTSC